MRQPGDGVEDGKGFQADGTANRDLEMKRYRVGLDKRVRFLVRYSVEREYCHGIDPEKQGRVKTLDGPKTQTTGWLGSA